MESGEHSGPVQECFVHWGKVKVKTSPYVNAQKMLVPKHQMLLKPRLSKV